MQVSTRSAPIDIQWSSNATYTLTASAVASDAVNVEFAKRYTLYPRYKAGAAETANIASITIEYNPYNEDKDPTGAHWFQIGNYLDATGTWTEESATYVVAQGTAGSYRNGVPIVLSNLDAGRIRVTAKETGVASNAGTLQVIMVKNEIT